MPTNFSKKGHSPDYSVIATVFILTIVGLIMLASASLELGKIRFNDSYYYLKRQLINGFSVGLIGFFLASHFYYRHYQKVAFPLLLISLFALGLVFTPFGSAVGGAGRWLTLGPLTFQPAEIVKLAFLVYLAAWLSSPKTSRERKFFEGFIPFLIMTGLVATLLVFQPATSTVVILVSAGLVIYFVSGAKLRYILLAIILGILSLGVLIYLTPYRLTRILTYVGYTSDLEGAGYHLNEALTALGSGGLFGIGYGQSFTKATRLPAPLSDSIFAVIGSELGFVGAGSLVVLFAFLTFRIFWLAKDFRDRFGRLLLAGFGTLVAVQSFINMAAISGLLPLTGVPLPFVSQGGTALAVFLTMAGIVVNISKYT